jgi:hypothetical protein
MLENSTDAVSLRVVAGLLGIALLGVLWWARSLLRADGSTAALRDTAVGAVATVAFTMGAAGLGFTGLEMVVREGSDGAGFFLTGAVASGLGVVLAAAFTYRRSRRLQTSRVQNAQTVAGTGITE